MKKFDEYTIFARFFPSIITILPLFILWYFLRQNIIFLNFGKYIMGLTFLGGITISIVFIYVYSQVIRLISKLFERKYFINRDGFPTTYLMLYSNKVYSDIYKDKYRHKVKKYFDFNLLDKNEEFSNIEESKKRLNEVTKQIILLIKDGQLVKLHNIWYGFFRNLIGGLPIAIFICVINIIIGVFINLDLIIFSSILLILYSIVIGFHKKILILNAEAYANQLISEFLSKE